MMKAEATSSAECRYLHWIVQTQQSDFCLKLTFLDKFAYKKRLVMKALETFAEVP